MVMRTILTATLAVFGLAGCGLDVLTSDDGQVDCTRAQASATIGGPFALTAHTGDVLTNEDFLGKPMLVYFGFTYCPDVCPLSLQRMALAFEQLSPAEREAVQPVLISVDPERDTPEELARYVDADGFPDNMIGLTGELEAIKAVADAYGAPFQKVYLNDSEADYIVGHYDLFFLMDEQGELVDIFAADDTPEQIAKGLSDHLFCAAEA